MVVFQMKLKQQSFCWGLALILSSMFRNRFEVINSLLPKRPKMLSDCEPNIIADFLVQV